MDTNQTPPPNTGPETPPVMRVATNDVGDNKDLAALSYAWVLSVFLYFWKKDSPFVHFHAKQGMVLFGASVIFWVIPFVNRVLELLVLAFCVFGFLAAAQGQWKDLPIVGDIASGRWSHVRQSWQDIVASIVRLWRRMRHSGKNAPTIIVTPPPSQNTEPPPPSSTPPTV
jgi:uncharacterized membrane protein